MKTYPLTESQLGLFLEWNADRDSAQYSLAYVYRLPKSADCDRLEKAIRAYLDAHPVFRTRLVETDGAVEQGVDGSIEFPFLCSEMSDAEADRYEKTFPHPFDLMSGPLMRYEFVTTPSGVRLFAEYAHIIVDGSSIHQMTDSISALYNGGEPVPESVPFEECVKLEAAALKGAEYEAAAAEAKARFAGKAMTVPEGGAADAAASDGANFFQFSAKLPRTAIDAFCRARSVRPNLFFMGVFARTLSLYANERDVVFQTVNHGRKDPRLKSTQGFLVKTLPVLAEMNGGLSLEDYFDSLRIHRAGVYPFTHFCRDLGIKPGWGFVYQEGTTSYRIALGTSVTDGVLLAGAAHAHPHGLRSGGRAIIDGSVGDIQTGKCADHALILEYVPERTLADFALVWSVGRDEFRT